MSTTVQAGVSTKARLESLDVFRGATIAAMLLVNNPGTSEAVYPPLRHAEWHGWTFTDLIFPFFLWIVGVAMTFSFGRRMSSGGGRGTLLAHAVRRAAIIFALGLLMAAVPRFDFATIRIPGVLQRIAVCYLAATVICLWTKVRGQIAWAAGLLAGYWVLMKLVPVPGYGAGVLEKQGNFAQYVDSLLLSGHMWGASGFWDPEGIVSTLPAISTTLVGILTGQLLRSKLSREEKTAWMFLAGNVLIVAGLIMNVWLPINKNLWTSSFAVFMAGMASSVFAAFYWLVDIRGWRRWGRPFAIYGMNAIFVYVLAGMLAKLLGSVHIGTGTGAGAASLKQFIFRAVFAPLTSPVNASVLYALSFVLLFYGVSYFMYRMKWFIKV
jgi:predicted acyltransferase